MDTPSISKCYFPSPLPPPYEIAPITLRMPLCVYVSLPPTNEKSCGAEHSSSKEALNKITASTAASRIGTTNSAISVRADRESYPSNFRRTPLRHISMLVLKHVNEAACEALRDSH